MRGYSVARGMLYASFFAWPAVLWMMIFLLIPTLPVPDVTVAGATAGLFFLAELALAAALSRPTKRELGAGAIATLINGAVAGVLFGFISPPPTPIALALVLIFSVVCAEIVMNSPTAKPQRL